MNHWQNEKIAELHRQDLINESKKIHRDTPEKRLHTHRPSLITRAKSILVNRTTIKGKKLRTSPESRTFSHVH